jgi:hypothetical protein
MVARAEHTAATGVTRQDRTRGCRGRAEAGWDRTQCSPPWPHASRSTGTRSRDHLQDAQETPKNATHWSTRTQAKELGTSKETVRRVWIDNGLQPHRVKTLGSEGGIRRKNSRIAKYLAHFATFAICCKPSHLVANRRIFVAVVAPLSGSKTVDVSL